MSTLQLNILLQPKVKPPKDTSTSHINSLDCVWVRWCQKVFRAEFHTYNWYPNRFFIINWEMFFESFFCNIFITFTLSVNQCAIRKEKISKEDLQKKIWKKNKTKEAFFCANKCLFQFYFNFFDNVFVFVSLFLLFSLNTALKFCLHF